MNRTQRRSPKPAPRAQQQPGPTLRPSACQLVVGMVLDNGESEALGRLNYHHPLTNEIFASAYAFAFSEEEYAKLREVAQKTAQDTGVTVRLLAFGQLQQLEEFHAVAAPPVNLALPSRAIVGPDGRRLN